MRTEPAWEEFEPVDLPTLTAERMRAVDEHVTQALGLPLVAMMENAGRHLAQALVAGWPDAEDTTVLAGKGHNGGGGLAAARHLASAGLDVAAHLAAQPDELAEATRVQARVLDRAGVPVRGPDEAIPAEPGALVDALLGYGQRGPPRGAVGRLAEAADDRPEPTLALDVPTGLDPDGGTWRAPAVRPAGTVTLCLPKRGLTRARPAPGPVLVADVGIPAAAIDELDASPFAAGPLVGFNETDKNR